MFEPLTDANEMEDTFDLLCEILVKGEELHRPLNFIGSKEDSEIFWHEKKLSGFILAIMRTDIALFAAQKIRRLIPNHWKSFAPSMRPSRVLIGDAVAYSYVAQETKFI